MKSHRQPLLLVVCLFFGATLCYAQREDTLKMKHNFTPPITKPGQIAMPNPSSLMPNMLGLDGLEYISPYPEDTTAAAPDLSVENYIRFYNDDYLEWEKDTYGWNYDLHQLTHKNRKYLTDSKYIHPKTDLTKRTGKNPFPLARGFDESPPAISIPINWGLTKHDKWYQENFGWDKRIAYNNVSVEQYEFRDVTEYKIYRMVDSVINRRKVEMGGTFNPDFSNLKKRIKRIKSDIARKARIELMPTIDSMR